MNLNEKIKDIIVIAIEEALFPFFYHAINLSSFRVTQIFSKNPTILNIKYVAMRANAAIFKLN
jgi:hypothetical protein